MMSSRSLIVVRDDRPMSEKSGPGPRAAGPSARRSFTPAKSLTACSRGYPPPPFRVTDSLYVGGGSNWNLRDGNAAVHSCGRPCSFASSTSTPPLPGRRATSQAVLHQQNSAFLLRLARSTSLQISPDLPPALPHLTKTALKPMTSRTRARTHLFRGPLASNPGCYVQIRWLSAAGETSVNVNRTRHTRRETGSQRHGTLGSAGLPIG